MLIRVTLLVTVLASPAVAQHWCDDPPSLEMLTGDPVAVDALASQGHPATASWYVTPPGEPAPTEPTSTGFSHQFTPDQPGLWSVACVVDYSHQAPGGGLWSSEACVTVRASAVVAVLGLGAGQITTDEALVLDGAGSAWAAGVEPTVDWQVDGLSFPACNGGPPPATPGDIECTVPADWLDPGWHTAGLLLVDPASGDSSLSTGSFEVIEVIPLSVQLGWTPFHPDPGDLVTFNAGVEPTTPEGDFTEVVWDFGDGTVVTYSSCPPPYYHTCLDYPHQYADDGWYDVSVTVRTLDETATAAGTIEVGDPVTPPTASFTVSPSAPWILQPTTLTFNGSCTGGCQFHWTFGDGFQSTTLQPSHEWPVPDRYPVELTVTNDGGSDSTTRLIEVSSCWNPDPPTQDGVCHGGPVWLTAPAGASWLWSTGASTRVVAAPVAGGYWVDVDDGAGCWGHEPCTVVLGNCGHPGGDSNLDGAVDAGDLAALLPELTDGDGDTVVGAGGGDLTAPGGDVTGDGRLRPDDLLTVLLRLFE